MPGRPGSGVRRALPYRFEQGAFDITVLSDGFITIPQDILLTGGNAGRTGRAPAAPGHGRRCGQAQGQYPGPADRHGSDPDRYRRGAPIPALGRQAGRPSRGRRDRSGHGHQGRLLARPSRSHLGHAGRERPAAVSRTPPITSGRRSGTSGWIRTSSPPCLPALHDFARGAQRDLGAVRERAVMLQAGDEIVTGLRALATPGHTPGHLSFEVAGGDGLLITVDAANNEVVSFEHPDWRFGYDTDPELGDPHARASFSIAPRRIACGCLATIGPIRAWASPSAAAAPFTSRRRPDRRQSLHARVSNWKDNRHGSFAGQGRRDHRRQQRDRSGVREAVRGGRARASS